jgi:uncharacterized repeat protein (TIGR03843 family)
VELSPAAEAELLAVGELEVVGRVAWSSNAALLVTVAGEGAEMLAVYKPRRGERPLWDFPDGTLCRREVATYRVSAALGWDVVPTTVLRDGPYGLGMVQRFVEHDPDDHYFTLLEHHADDFRRFAVLDVVVNNADRKGGHCLCEMATGHVYGIDHGLTFHVGPKLRTVIWDFAAEPVPDALLADVDALRTDLRGGLGAELRELLHPAELDALDRRIEDLLLTRRFPEPDEGYHSVPWPVI